jgi:hypothetical protein
MPRSPLFGRRIHISGRISADAAIATQPDVQLAREMVKLLVRRLVRLGATFVVPVDAEHRRAVDGEPICFDWLVWQAIRDSLSQRPAGARDPLAIAVLHHKNEDQVPPEFSELWDELRGSDRIQIESAARWNMNSKRMEAQARWGDVLIALGGCEGVHFLANLYHDAGRPVIPLPLRICSADAGARQLFHHAEIRANSGRFFQTEVTDPHTWTNRMNFPVRTGVPERVNDIIALLEDLEPPRAFAVRLLNPDHEDFIDVDTFFDVVVKPVVEDELGYKLAVVDGRQAFREARIDGDIFARLHRSALVIADYTGSRPNCFVEMGYALGRGAPTIVTAREGTTPPFDIHTVAALMWKPSGSVEERRRAFRDHWEAVRNRPPLVRTEPLIP